MILTLGNSVGTIDEQGKLNQSVTYFVKGMGVKYLQLVNPRGNVKAIGSFFLYQCTALISIGIRGLTSLQSIGDFPPYRLASVNIQCFEQIDHK